MSLHTDCIVPITSPELQPMAVGYRRFQIGCVLVEYDLFNTTTFIQNCMYMNFRINLTSDRYRSTPEILRFHPIPPFIFPLQSL